MTGIVERLHNLIEADDDPAMVRFYRDCLGEIERLRRDLVIWQRNGGDILQRAEITRLRGALDNVVQAKDDTVLTIAIDYARKVLSKTSL